MRSRGAAPGRFSTAYLWPERSDIDAPLVAGAVLFGIGWGLVGICPGPALVNLAGFSLPIVVFVVAMLLGMIGYEFLAPRRRRVTRDRDFPQFHLVQTGEP